MLYFLLRKRFIIVMIASICLVFTKETGVLLYLVSIGIYLFMNYKELHFSRKTALNKQFLPLYVPLMLLILYVDIKVIFLKQPFLWDMTPHLLNTSSTFAYQTLKAYFVDIFILNFNWLLSSFIIIALIKAAYDFKKKRHFNIGYRLNNKQVFFLALLFIAVCFLLTIPKTFNNVRYFLTLYPLLLILFSVSLIIIGIKSFLRKAILCFLFIVFFFCNFYTFDPLSKSIYGTFAFGSHPLLKMTSINNGCCGYGIDPLVYNTEFVYFDYLQNIIYRDIKPTNNTYIVTDKTINWHLASQLNKATYSRTLRVRNTILPRYVTSKEISLLKVKPKIAYFIAYPNMSSKNLYALLLKHYVINNEKKYSLNGYAITVAKLMLRKV